jgi:hypothetical protein
MSFKRSRSVLVQREGDAWWVVVDTDRRGPFERKRDAARSGREVLSHHGGGELVIHSVSGRITERDTVPARQTA